MNRFGEQPNTMVYGEKRRAWREGTFIGALLLAMLAAQEVVVFLLQLSGHFGWLNLAQRDYGLGQDGYTILSMVMYLFYLPAPALLVGLISRRHTNPFPTRRVSIGMLLVVLAVGMAFSVLANLATSLLVNFLDAAGIPLPVFPDSIAPTASSLILNIVSTALLPALCEELIFRGYLAGTLRAQGDTVAVWMSASVFGLFHGNIVQVPFAFIVGLVLGWLFIRTGSIWPCVLVHFGNNLMSVLITYLSKVYPDAVSNRLSVAVFLVVTAVGMVALVALITADRGSGIREDDLLFPIGTGAGALTTRRRALSICLSPAMLAALVWLMYKLGRSVW